MLRVGDHRERIAGREIPDADRPPILKAYLDKYQWQVGAQFDVPRNPSLAQLAEIAGDYPVFAIRTRDFA